MDIKSTSHQAQSFDLNTWAAEKLDSFANTSVKIDNGITHLTNSIEGAIAANITEGALNLSSYGDEAWDLASDRIAHNIKYGLDSTGLSRITDYVFKPGVISKGFEVLGKGLDAATGIISTGKALRHDLDTGNKSLSGTMTEITKATLKTGLASVGGAALASAFAVGGGVLGAVVVPAAIGIGGAVAIGYGVDKGVDLVSHFDYKGTYNSISDSVSSLADSLKFW